MPYGKSKPIKIVANDGKIYIVKFRKDYMKGKDRSITNEYIAYRLIEELTLKIAPQVLKFIVIDDLAIKLAEKSNLSKDSLEYMKQSKGINIAIEFLENCEKAEKNEVTNSFKKEVRTIDEIVMNDDRTIDNTNILKDITRKNKFYAIDWGLSFDSSELYSDVKQKNISKRFMYYMNADVVKRPEYIFRDISSFKTLNIKDIEGIIRKIVDEIPDDWETKSCSKDIAEILIYRVSNKIKHSKKGVL